jgi:hypothetical protein
MVILVAALDRHYHGHVTNPLPLNRWWVAFPPRWLPQL